MKNEMQIYHQAKGLFTVALLFITCFANGQVGKWKSIDETTSWLNSNISSVRQDDVTFDQEIKTDKNNYDYARLTVKETDPKKSVTHLYEFYPAHLDAIKTNFEIKGTQINVIAQTTDDLKVVKYYKDGEFKGYQNEVIIKADDPQLAKDIVEAINYSISNTSYSSPAFTNEKEAVQWLTGNIRSIEIPVGRLSSNFNFSPMNGTSWY